MIKLGDKVRFVNENMEGIVTSLKGKNQIGVTVDSDFEIPVLISEVVKIKYEEKAGNNPELPVSKPFRAANNAPLGVFLAFERLGDTELKAHLHNNLSEEAFVLVYRKVQGVFQIEKSIKLERDETVLLHACNLNDFEKWAPYQFVILPFESTTIQPSGSIQTPLSFQSKTFHQYWKHCFFLEKQAYVFRLDEPLEKLNLQALKNKDFTEKVAVLEVDLKSKPASIIDLHYDYLKANGYGVSDDITGLQMKVFTETLDAAFVHHVKEMIYIHGVGNSYLKNKIRTYLSKHPEMVLEVKDADILQYGGGATLVILK
jgi:hypothetical protein